MSESTDVLDQDSLSHLLDVIGGDTSDLAELIESFLSETPMLLGQLQEGLSHGRSELVRRAAHTLKSGARDFGVLGLAALCAQLEHESSAAMPLDAASLVAGIHNQYDLARPALESLLKAYRS